MATNSEQKPLSIGLCLCIAYFALAMVVVLALGLLCSPHQFAYDLSMVHVLLLMAGGSVTIWLISQRASTARPVGTIVALVCAALSAVDQAAFGAFESLSTYFGFFSASVFTFVEFAGAIAVSLYLVFAPGAKRVLCMSLDLLPGSDHDYTWQTPFRERVRKWEFWRDLLIYFIVFSIVGHWAEMLFCQLIVAGVFMGGYDPSNAMLWSQWLFPFTAEGAALVAIVLLLHPASRWLLKKTGNRVVLAVLLSFLLNAAVCTAIDFTTGMVANQNYELWDYRSMPFNFMGQVCLQNSLVYSIAATLIVWVVYPLMDRFMHRAPRGVVNSIAFGLIGMYLFLAMLYFIDIAALWQ